MRFPSGSQLGPTGRLRRSWRAERKGRDRVGAASDVVRRLFPAKEAFHGRWGRGDLREYRPELSTAAWLDHDPIKLDRIVV